MASDSEDLEALFEATAQQAQAALEAAAAPAGPARATKPRRRRSSAKGAGDRDLSERQVFVRVGELTRTLHDALRQLGYDRHIAAAVGDLPDAQSRLSYIADLTGNAAEKVLGIVDEGIAAEHAIGERARAMAERLGSCGVPSLRAEARAFALEAEAHAQAALGRYTDIMMAQDFHDLTGQTVKRVAEVAQRLEQQLVKLLLDMTPQEARPNEAGAATLEGPVIDPTRADVVHDQAQVDELLESLGF